MSKTVEVVIVSGAIIGRGITDVDVPLRVEYGPFGHFVTLQVVESAHTFPCFGKGQIEQKGEPDDECPVHETLVSHP